MVLAINNAAPNTKGAPGNLNGALVLIKYAKRLVMIGGPIIDVALIKLVSAPCNSPCSLGGTWDEMVACNAGPAIPPRQYGTRKANIIHDCVAKANRSIPIEYRESPI